MAAKKSPFFDTATTLGKIVAFFGVSALCGVLTAAMLTPVAALATTGFSTGTKIVNALPSSFEKMPIPEPSRVLDRNGEVLATFYDQNRKPVKLDDISPHMRKAIIAIEDERFYEHNGIDPRGISRAAISNMVSSSRQGASTLTQQYVNNLLVNNQELTGSEESTISGQKDYADKIRELKYSVAIENEMSKDEILEGYLNLVLFSGREYGVQAAAQRFFSVDAKDLNLQQSATLAGMVQLPNVLNPLTNPERSKERRNLVLGNMLRTGAIDQEEYDKAVKSELETKPSRAASGCMAADDSAYFCNYVSQLIMNDSEFGKTRDDRKNLLFKGGLTIKTTVDGKLNKKAAKESREMVPADDKSNLGASIVSVEPGTGNILAMAQNKIYSPEKGSENTEYNFAVSKAYGGAGGFQGGSTMKPYTTLAWLKEGHRMWDRIDATKRSFSVTHRWKATCMDKGYVITGGGEPWSPGNASRGFSKPMTVDYGLYWSVNSATIAQAAKVDLCNISDYTAKLGVLDHDAYTDSEGNVRWDPHPISPKNPSFVIGSAKVTPLSKAAAFAAFADGGNFCEPRTLTEVTDAAGNSYKVKPQTCSQQVNEQIVADLNGTLQKIASKRVAKGRISAPIAGKTGTNNTASSTWFVGYTTGISTAAWVGRLDKQNEDTRFVTVDGVPHRNVDSSTFAAPLWYNFMSDAINQFEHKSFKSGRSKPAPEPEPTQGSSDDSESASTNRESAARQTPEQTEASQQPQQSSAPEQTTESSERESEPEQNRGNGNGNGNGNGKKDDD